MSVNRRAMDEVLAFLGQIAGLADGALEAGDVALLGSLRAEARTLQAALAAAREPYQPELRDYFAAKAMQGYRASASYAAREDDQIAEWAYKQADAMLAARAADPKRV